MAEEKQVTDIDKKCAHTGKAIKRVRRYYRNGLYFINKAAFQAWQQKQRETAAAAAPAEGSAPVEAKAEAKPETKPEAKPEAKAEEKKG